MEVWSAIAMHVATRRERCAKRERDGREQCSGLNLTSHRSCRVIVQYAPAAICTRDRAALRPTGARSTSGTSIELTGPSPDVPTTLAMPVPAGETRLTVRNVSDICVGQTIVVGGTGNLDARTVASIGAAESGGTPITVTAALTHAHAAGEPATFRTP